MVENGSGRRIALLMFDTISPSLTPGSFFIFVHSGCDQAETGGEMAGGKYVANFATEQSFAAH